MVLGKLLLKSNVSHVIFLDTENDELFKSIYFILTLFVVSVFILLIQGVFISQVAGCPIAKVVSSLGNVTVNTNIQLRKQHLILFSSNKSQLT